MSKPDEKQLTETNEVVDAMFFSRPLNFPGTAFGSLNIFFDPKDIPPLVMEDLGKGIAIYIEDYFISLKKVNTHMGNNTKLN